MIRINQIKFRVCPKEDKLKNLNKKIKSIIKTEDYSLVRIVKESVDARDKTNLRFIYSVDIQVDNENKLLKSLKGNKDISVVKDESYVFPYYSKQGVNQPAKENCESDKQLRPVIVGAGPAGYFSALWLARAGFKPIVVERGRKVEQRNIDVQRFWDNGTINPESNVSFGEGGAGTFSDGKLSTGIKDKQHRVTAVLNDFVKFGADPDITYVNKPHIGTNVLVNVMKNMRHEIIALGGSILFDTRLVDIKLSETSDEPSEAEMTSKAQMLKNITLDVTDNVEIDKLLPDIPNNHRYIYKDNRTYIELETDALILAIGHSARDTFIRLNELGVPMEAKAFAMGVRIEHKSDMIQKSQYGDSKEASYLPPASYKLTHRSSEGRSVYSFCMCPGGYVVNASSDTEQAVVNGMSYRDRGGENSNSAIVVNVTPEDFKAEGFDEYGVLAGMYFQRKYEKLAYNEGKSFIPVQLYGDYKEKRVSRKIGDVKPNIKGNYTFGDLNNCLPPYVNNAIIDGIEYYDTRLKGFADKSSVLSGIESRTSSPVRILRDENYMSSICGIFPCGEGAGYAGGITSAAVDGIKVAESCAKYIIRGKRQ
jgi:uncharacterized FAD-dependent dehydrogenase